MQTNESVKNVFTQLEESLRQLTDAEYKQPCATLFNATIGQHVRHIIELFICLYKGYDIGIIDYDNRERDIRIESHKDFAIELLQVVISDLNKHNKDLLLAASYGDNSSPLLITTSFNREVIYNLEHTIHHMALIRVGINEVSDLALPDEFGVAASTIRYRRKCA
ncbi:DinB family protein [Mucilaginibacter ginsenosidivorans]|uniref:DinB family protein n=1 Tax=Mucilaginibacter ginsenosidivorans TaxID=398053 RepID=A0A5B8UZ57_9SPHI|nr:DinB family protein [Mucilaginibacter ginsenosidivorans]QEC64035.1 DinB family protein [Mucilaginibacter ginsenosidivorans]